MRNVTIVLLVFVFTICMNAQNLAQNEQGGRGGLDFRNLRPRANQSNQAQRASNLKTEAVKITTGVRRLVPDEFATIQAAINASAHGDTVLVSDGTYLENIRYFGKAITVASHYLIDADTLHIENTIIDGSNPSNPDSASVVSFVDGEDTTSVLCGFTITGGAGTLSPNDEGYKWRQGGGIFGANFKGATIINNHIKKNRISGVGSAGGGICFELPSNFLIIEGNRIADNYVSTTEGWGYGGGISIFGPGVYVRVIDNVFERDTVVAQTYSTGGGLDFSGYTGLVDGFIQDNVFRENVSEAKVNNGLGGGLSVYATESLLIKDNLFDGNTAKSRNAYAEGGGILIDDEYLESYGRKTILGNRFLNNQSISQSGNGSGGALEIFRTIAAVSGNYFDQNTAESGSGLGGAIRIYKSAFKLENNILTQNSAKYGGAVYVSGAPQMGNGLNIINNTMVNNIASEGSGGIQVSIQTNLLNSILWGNTPNQLSGSITVKYSDIQGGWSGSSADNIDADPIFKDGLFELDDNSPCLGKGIITTEINGTTINCPSTCYLGNPRPMPSGSNPDMGAIESPLATDIYDMISPLPQDYSLLQNYPNPFNPTTVISYQLAAVSNVELSIYNLLGQKVSTLVNREQNSGRYLVEWNATGFSSGVYFYKIQTDQGFAQTRKLVLLK